MKRYCLERPGSIDGLIRVDAPDPVPGPGEVLIAMRAASLNYRDLMIAKSTYEEPHPGLIPLSDGAGAVIAIGDGVERFAIGDRVCPIFRPDWQGGPLTGTKTRAALGGSAPGILAERVVAHETAIVRVPDTLDYREAATLPCAAVTAFYSLSEIGRVGAGDTVLVQGTGGVSVFALQFAKAMGARVIATSSSDDKLERVRGLGADDTINYRDTPEWQEAVLALTDGVGVDHVVEVGGAGTLPRSMQAVRRGGSIGVIGVLTGKAEIDPMPILQRAIHLQGVAVGPRDTFEAMNRMIAYHDIHPVIDRIFAFDDAVDAYRHLDKAGHIGKVVIDIG